MPNQHSEWHTVRSAEIWFHHRGSPLLLRSAPTAVRRRRRFWDRTSRRQQPQVLVPPDTGSALARRRRAEPGELRRGTGFRFRRLRAGCAVSVARPEAVFVRPTCPHQATSDLTPNCRVITVFLVDDHDLVRQGLVELLNADPELDVVGEADTVAAAMARIPAVQPDVAVLDVRFPDGNGIDLCRGPSGRRPATAASSSRPSPTSGR